LCNEAIRAYEEGVAGQPSSQAGSQIDLGSIMGFGFPPYLGGVYYCAKQIGYHEVEKNMKKFEALIDSSFKSLFELAPAVRNQEVSAYVAHTTKGV
jgi:hypothetical protein